MTTCPYCGKQNNTPDAVYCSYCGSSLSGAHQQEMSQTRQPFSYGTNYPTNAQGLPSFDTSERYERALKRAEQLGIVVAILSLITLFLVLA